VYLYFLAAIVLGLIVFAVRLLQWYLYLGRRLKGKFLSNADTWVFFIDAKKIRENNFKLSSRIREDSVEADKYYPPLFFYLLAIFPEKLVKPLVKYAPALSDAFISLVLTVSAMLITDNWVLAILAAGVYLSSPMVFQQTFCFCIRPLSILLISFIYLFSLSFSWLNFFVIAILAMFVLLLHKFATQIVFFTALAFLSIWRFDYLVSVVLGFIIAIGVSKAYYLKVLKAHLAHLKSGYLKQFIHSHAESPLRKTAVLAIYCPWIVFFAASIFAVWHRILLDDLWISTLVWVITLILLAVVTNFWKFRIIGEGWRYLGYLPFSLAFWAVNAIAYSPDLLWVYTVFAVLGVIVSYYYVLRLFRRHQQYLISEADIDFFKQISSLEGRTITALPKEFTYPLSFFSGKDYSAKLDIDFEGKALSLAEIVVLDKTAVPSNSYEELEKRGYSVKLENDRWAAYSPKLYADS
jgi:hypothetical protein